jgi:hypothetical protein
VLLKEKFSCWLLRGFSLKASIRIYFKGEEKDIKAVAAENAVSPAEAFFSGEIAENLMSTPNVSGR